ncbi:MAG: malto-oligosyltrehalose synthase, partial [Polyangiales bacterium]
FGAELHDVHAHFMAAAPRGLIATSTHDTKRSEDVRARIAVISEVPALWETRVTGWGERAAAGWGDAVRDRTLEYLIWQTLVGAWPISLERAQRYAEKTSREARLRTS